MCDPLHRSRVSDLTASSGKPAHPVGMDTSSLLMTLLFLVALAAVR
jgi:hypothetical protein